MGQRGGTVLKPGGSLYVVSGYTNLRHILNALAETELQEVNHIIWKYNFGVYTSKKYISSHYHILFYTKPGAKRIFNTYAFYGDGEKTAGGGSLNYMDREDVWHINKEYKPGRVKNKNELPETLLKKIISYSSDVGDLVCDFFLGGFSTAKASLKLGRKACGFEVNKTAFDYQIKEIKKIAFASELPALAVSDGRPVNRGKKLGTEERTEIISFFTRVLSGAKRTKKEAINMAAKKFGRGYWSVTRIIEKASSEDSESVFGA